MLWIPEPIDSRITADLRQDGNHPVQWGSSLERASLLFPWCFAMSQLLPYRAPGDSLDSDDISICEADDIGSSPSVVDSNASLTHLDQELQSTSPRLQSPHLGFNAISCAQKSFDKKA